ncbi:MAG: hypothetical protein JWN57_1426 [Frankiales bacterium]|nr:hypothetical protein [Frankiales bacterium]
MLRRLLGLDRTSVVRLYDRVIDRKALPALIGWVPQGDGVFLDQTVLDTAAAAPAHLDATLQPLLSALLAQADHVEAAVIAGCAVDDWAVRADSVALVADGRVVVQDVRVRRQQRPDGAVEDVLPWVS